tara:strand:- start:147 stop:1286 length:1140 start_codon:yes stop_codon:yes gene_type:complete
MIKILSVVGARPNFMKIAPFIEQINKNTDIRHILVHTGQHYDARMSRNFFNTLGIPIPDVNLSIGSGTHSRQIGDTMIAFEKILIKEKPDWVVVVGDVNATLACSITAKKMNLKVCHIEAGLRSGDITMPEEINRLVTDRISDLLLTPDLISSQNLLNEGISNSKIKFVGNIMIDTLDKNIKKAKSLSVLDIINSNVINKKNKFNHKNFKKFGLVTMHRPSNVDSLSILKSIIQMFINDISKKMHLLWPIHPRTQKKLKEFDLYIDLLNCDRITMLHPIDYIEMIKLNSSSKIVFTDSGGLQEECTILSTPCLTMRWNTERPITLLENGGVSLLVGNDVQKIKHAFNQIRINEEIKRPKYWDGKTAFRCLSEILSYKYE